MLGTAPVRRTDSADVIVVGAGAAGLAAARHLHAAGVAVTVLEAADAVGGRMSTRQLDGYRLDLGGQLLCPDWPEQAHCPGLEPLALRPFAPGAVIRWEDRSVRVGGTRSLRPRTGLSGGLGSGLGGGLSGGLSGVRGSSSGGVGGRGGRTHAAARRAAGAPRAGDAQTAGGGDGPPAGGGWGTAGSAGGSTGGARQTARALASAVDAARLRGQLSRLAATEVSRLRSRTELPAHRALAARGIPGRTLDGLLRPLVGALTGDPDLAGSSRMVDLALRGFARRGLCLPAGGASAVPELLASGLPPGTVRTGVRAVAVSTNAVETDTEGVLGCRAVLIATGAQSAAQLLPGLHVPPFHPVAVLHHAADSAPPPAETALLLDADRRGPVAHTMVASAVDPARADAGRTLVTSVVLGPAALGPVAELDRAARPQLAELHGAAAGEWELLAAHRDAFAVPAMPAPHDAQRPVRVLCGLYVCGDHRDTSSLQGALHSARRACGAICRDFGIPMAADSALAEAA